MAGIENLKERILRDDTDRANEIEKEAAAKAEEVINSARQKAQAITEDMKVKAEKDGKDRKDRIIARTHLEARNSILAAKQQVIDNILNQVVVKIENMDSREYSDFIEKMILSSSETGSEEVIFSAEDIKKLDPALIDRVNDKLKLSGKNGSIRISSENRNISAGFILKRGDLEINCSIASQIRIVRDELEAEISKIVFAD